MEAAVMEGVLKTSAAIDDFVDDILLTEDERLRHQRARNGAGLPADGDPSAGTRRERMIQRRQKALAMQAQVGALIIEDHFAPSNGTSVSNRSRGGTGPTGMGGKRLEPARAPTTRQR